MRTGGLSAVEQFTFPKYLRLRRRHGGTASVAEVIIQPITARLDPTGYFSASPDEACLAGAPAWLLLLDRLPRSRSTVNFKQRALGYTLVSLIICCNKLTRAKRRLHAPTTATTIIAGSLKSNASEYPRGQPPAKRLLASKHVVYTSPQSPSATEGRLSTKMALGISFCETAYASF